MSNADKPMRLRPDDHPRNALFAGLQADQLRRVTLELECVPLALGQVLYESGEEMSHAYFPIDCIVSLLYVMENGESAEIAVVGHEGMIGIALFMGGNSTMSRAVVQNAGHAYRMPAAALVAEFHRGQDFSQRLLMFSLALINQMVQTAACNRHHTLDQQLCRWPIGNFSQLARFSEACGAEIPRWLRLRMESYGDDAASIRALGLDVVSALCERLRDGGAPGLHFYTLNQAELATEICRRIGS